MQNHEAGQAAHVTRIPTQLTIPMTDLCVFFAPVCAVFVYSYLCLSSVNYDQIFSVDSLSIFSSFKGTEKFYSNVLGPNLQNKRQTVLRFSELFL